MFVALYSRPAAEARDAGLGTAMLAFVGFGTLPAYLLTAVMLAERLRAFRMTAVVTVALSAVFGTPLLIAGASALTRHLAGALAGLGGAVLVAALLLGSGVATLLGYAIARAVPGWRVALSGRDDGWHFVLG